MASWSAPSSSGQAVASRALKRRTIGVHFARKALAGASWAAWSAAFALARASSFVRRVFNGVGIGLPLDDRLQLLQALGHVGDLQALRRQFQDAHGGPNFVAGA